MNQRKPIQEQWINEACPLYGDKPWLPEIALIEDLTLMASESRKEHDDYMARKFDDAVAALARADRELVDARAEAARWHEAALTGMATEGRLLDNLNELRAALKQQGGDK